VAKRATAKFALLTVLAIVFLGSGCSKGRDVNAESEAWPATNIFDAILKQPSFAARVRAAEQDLPGDQWDGRDKGGNPINTTRSGREVQIAVEVVNEGKPRLKMMSTRDLFFSLKTYRIDQSEFRGVEYRMHLIGNSEIMSELRSRSPRSIKQLSRLRFPHREVWTGAGGPPLAVDEVIPAIMAGRDL
jgi:hypothetical protein